MFSSLNMRHMRSFVAVADHGSFTAAAAVLGVTPPSLTTTIRQFEDVTGAALFDRTTRQVTLTDTGERFLPVAKRLIGDFEEALGDLDALSKGIGGKITIAAAPSVLTRILPAVISRFVVDHPDARLRLDEMNAGEVHAAVAANEADFGIAGEWEALPDIAFRPLFSDRFGVLCRADHAFAKHPFVTWAQLADQPFVGLGPESGTSAMMAGVSGEPRGEGTAKAPQHSGSDFTSPAIEDAARLGIAAAKGVMKQAKKLARAQNKLTDQRTEKAAKSAVRASAGDGASAMPITLPRPTVEASNTLTLAAMVAQGVGITVLPELAARVSDMTRDKGLVFVPLSAPVRQRHIGIITRKSKSLSPIASLFLHQVREQAAGLDLPAALEWY
ncbi:LysR family transcriptional regulator [Thalassospira sp. MCCC 1A02491]|uniref:LysR family transcriptional regulator n=1 Tax=Thalassospira sp. MCCC 1A02491 TaxID=1769751 RepID=UPI0007AD6FCC|nr:LysR family transcriptional regulator [Thalassospira sp. MCCC 1A02491]KZB65086.1 LysR family transcriptional regulator [Thalassospira sp. MCCC 1A02491]